MRIRRRASVKTWGRSRAVKRRRSTKGRFSTSSTGEDGCASRPSLMPDGSVVFGGRHEEDLSDLDCCTARFGTLARPRHRLIHVSALQYPKTAYVLLGFEIGPVGEEHIAIGLKPQCAGCAQAAGELPDTSSNHFAIERVNLLDRRFVLCGGVEVVGEVTGNQILRHVVS